MKLKALLAGTLLAALVFTGCEESSTIGSSLVANSVEIHIDSLYTITGHTTEIGPMRPKTSTQLIGNITAPGYGTLSSSTVMQFISSTVLDTANFSAADVDSMAVKFRYARGDFWGDSIVPMQLSLYQLNKPLPAGITSDFDPAGWYDTKPLGSLVYNNSTLGNDSVGVLTYREITVKLPDEMGPRIFRTFEEHPEYFENGTVFAEHVFPGLYAATTFGQGRLTRVAETVMTMYLTSIKDKTVDGETKKDTTHVEHQYFMVTPEVESSNNISYKMDASLEAMKDAGDVLIVAPGAYQAEFRFPTPELLATYNNTGTKLTVVNGLSLKIPVDSIANDFQIGPAPYVLMVLKKDCDEFFAKNKLPDNITSFYASYNSATKVYSFSDLRSYIVEMASREEITEEDYTFYLVPVAVSYEKSGTDSYYSTATMVETSVLPYVEGPAMGKLKLDEAEIKFIYTLQSKK